MAHGFESFAIPKSSFDARPYIFGLPIFKLVFEGGYLAVPVFFIMSGYVCSMKPLKLSRAGKPDEARRVIASSAFRRIIRLFIPASIATIISWFLANTGGFNLAMSQPGNCWLNFHSGRPSETWPEAFKSLFHDLVYIPSPIFQLNGSFIPGFMMEKPGGQCVIHMNKFSGPWQSNYVDRCWSISGLESPLLLPLVIELGFS